MAIEDEKENGLQPKKSQKADDDFIEFDEGNTTDETKKLASMIESCSKEGTFISKYDANTLNS